MTDMRGNSVANSLPAFEEIQPSVPGFDSIPATGVWTADDLLAMADAGKKALSLEDEYGADQTEIGGIYNHLYQQGVKGVDADQEATEWLRMSRETGLSSDTIKGLRDEVESPMGTLRPAPQGGFFKRFFVPENTNLPSWQDSTRREKSERMLKAVTGFPTRIALGLMSIPANTAWAVVKRSVPPEKFGEYENLTLTDAVNRASGESPSSLEQIAAGLAEFIGPAKVLGPVMSKVLPSGNAITEGVKLFGAVAAANQASKKAAQAIDPSTAEYGYEGAIAVLESMGLGGALGKIQSTGLPKIAKLALESTLFGGVTAAQGGTAEDIATQALIPVALSGKALFRRKVMTEAVKRYGEDIIKRSPESAPEVVKQVEKIIDQIEAGKFDETEAERAKGTAAGVGKEKKMPTAVEEVMAEVEKLREAKPASAVATGAAAAEKGEVAPSPAAPGKQAWEMTREEYTSAPLYDVTDTRGYGQLGGGPTGNIGSVFRGLTKAEADAMAKRQNAEAKEKYNQSNPVRVSPSKDKGTAAGHKLIVSDAVKLGQPVPTPVLREYASEKWAQEELAKRETAPVAPGGKAELGPTVSPAGGGLAWHTAVREALRQVKEIQPQVKMEQHEERVARARKLESLKDWLIEEQGVSPEEALQKAKSALSGPLTEYQRYEGLSKFLSKEALDAAFRDIATTDVLRPYERINTADAFTKLRDGFMLAPWEAELIKKWRPELADVVEARTDKSTVYQRMMGLWRAGLLTGMKTTGMNVLANFSHAMSEIAKDVPAVAADSVQSLFTGKRAIAFTVRGTKEGVREGFGKGWSYLRTGIDERNIGEKYDYRKVNFGTSKFAQGIQTYEEFVFRLMGAEDQPFYYGAKARSITEQAIVQAKNEGLKGDAFNKRVDELTANPTDEMVKYATLDAEVAVFQNQTALGEMGAAIQRYGGELIVPFSRTPAAIAMQIFNYTPAGTIKELLHQIRTGKYDQRLLSQAIGRSATGATVLTIGGALFAAGLMTLGYPANERERELWQAEGRKENSIKVGNKWRSVFVLGPVGNVLLIGGYIWKGYQESGSPSKAMATGMAGAGKTLVDETFLRGMNQFMEAIKDPERSFDSFFASMAGSIVPTIVADFARATDTTERVAPGPAQRIASRLPGLRETLEPRVGMFGQDVPRYGGNVLEVMADPTRPSKIRHDEVVDELRRLWDVDVKVAPTKLGNKLGYDILSEHENNILWRRAGELTYAGLLELIKKPRYENLSDKAKGEYIERVVKKAKDWARAEAAVARIDAGATVAELKEGKLVTEDVEHLLRRARAQRSKQ